MPHQRSARAWTSQKSRDFLVSNNFHNSIWLKVLHDLLQGVWGCQKWSLSSKMGKYKRHIYIGVPTCCRVQALHKMISVMSLCNVFLTRPSLLFCVQLEGSKILLEEEDKLLANSISLSLERTSLFITGAVGLSLERTLSSEISSNFQRPCSRTKAFFSLVT